ncbi:tetratricopeptide repeat protein [Rhodospirillaceae bacterium KN72]|uniref:Tetratricopeptide repeat protein n=1 Tax=Pacificispira spongiicola TaxID=2729598 RepID=A0A7Y0E0T6_9PROT|nr:tetratricopeptide repeat protein [Pacificispira spongiicola]NMM45152.1 tetratricopeptide repeat protein [Pacificispira spongiicola]
MILFKHFAAQSRLAAVEPCCLVKRLAAQVFGATALAVVIGGFSANTVSAQTVSPEQGIEEQDTRTSEVEQTLRASRIAIESMNDPNCPDTVTYADILTNPDDVQLNICYALYQVNVTGDVRGAAATLERVLLIAPDAANVRLLYAMVLFRLDNMDEAEGEFRTVSRLQLDEETRAFVDDYLDRIEKRRRKLKQSATISVGSYYDTNRNSAPQSEELLAVGTRSPISINSDRPNGILGFLTILGYDVTYDPGFQNQHEIFGGADLYADTLTEQAGSQDVHSMSLDAGVRLRYPGITVSPRVFMSNMRLGWTKFYQSEGIELRVDHKHKFDGTDWPLLDTWALVSQQNEGYHNTPDYQSLTLRKGKKFDAKLGFGMLVHPNHYLSAVGHYQFKSAAADPANNGARIYSYQYHNVELSHTWLLENSRFLLTNLLVGSRRYQSADAFIVGAQNVRRLEQPVRLRMTYGMPLADLVNFDASKRPSGNMDELLADLLKDTTISFTGEHTYQRSNITNYQYRSSRAQFLLTKRLDF